MHFGVPIQGKAISSDALSVETPATQLQRLTLEWPSGQDWWRWYRLLLEEEKPPCAQVCGFESVRVRRTTDVQGECGPEGGPGRGEGGLASEVHDRRQQRPQRLGLGHDELPVDGRPVLVCHFHDHHLQRVRRVRSAAVRWAVLVLQPRHTLLQLASAVVAGASNEWSWATVRGMNASIPQNRLS